MNTIEAECENPDPIVPADLAKMDPKEIFEDDTSKPASPVDTRVTNTLPQAVSLQQSVSASRPSPFDGSLPKSAKRIDFVRHHTPHLYKMVDEKDHFFIWNVDRFFPIDDLVLENEVSFEYAKFKGDLPNRDMAKSIVGQIMNNVQNRCRYSMRHIIGFDDCIKEVTKDGSICNVLPNPEDGVFVSLPMPFPSETAPCEKWLRFLDTVLPDQEVRSVVQRFLGLSLVVSLNPQCALFLIGRGGNGKTVLLSAIKEILGDLASRMNVHEIGDNQLAEQLVGKVVNVSEEIHIDKFITSDSFKSVVGDSAISVNPKYRQPYTSRAIAKWLVAANEYPSFDTVDEAIERRLIMLPMDAKILPENQRPLPELLAEFASERPGIIRWLLDGLCANFTDKTSLKNLPIVAKHRRLWRLQNSPIEAWLAEVQLDGQYAAKKLYEDFSEWVKPNGFREMNSSTFGKRLGALGYENKHVRDGTMWTIKPRTETP